MYSNTLLMMRLLHTCKRMCPSSVFALSPRHFLSNVSHFGKGVSLHVQSHLLQVANMGSASRVSPQFMICIGAILVAWTHASLARYSCLPISSLHTLASPLSTTPTKASFNKDWMVSLLWQMGTQLKASAASLSAPDIPV